MKRILWLILLALPISAMAQTLTMTPTIAALGGSNVTFTVTCTCNDWTPGTPGTPTFNIVYDHPTSITGPGLVSQEVLTSNTAQVVISPGNYQNIVSINAPAASGKESPSLATFIVQPPFHPAQPFILNGAVSKSVSFTGIGTAWTSSSPTFTLSGCPTAALTGTAITSDTNVNLTFNAGTTDCTITVTDSSTSDTTTLGVHTPTTYYVDSVKGSTRYSADETSGHCNGLSDTPYTSGTNQSCPFSDLGSMWQTGVQAYGVGSHYGWLLHGGDTLIIVGAISDGVSYRVGWHSSSGCGPDTNGLYWGLCGDAQDVTPPTPSGIPEDHTVIEGADYASCTSKTARTQIHAGYGVSALFNMGINFQYAGIATLDPSDYIDMKCLDLTDWSPDGSGDFALNGIAMSYLSNHATYTDIKAHGFKGAGFLGETGGNIVATDVQFDGNFSAGWNTDRGKSITGFGSLDLTKFEIIGNGCYEEYPVVDAMPYNNCHDQNDGGYGDGFGTTTVNSPSPGWQLSFDQGQVAYNTQDGIDTLHVAGIGSSTKITRSLLYGNMGNQIKIGGTEATVQNNIVNGNCGAMSSTIPGFPSGYNTAMVGQGGFCRAGNTAVVMEIEPGVTDYFENNTVFSAGYVGVEYEPYNYIFKTVFTGTERLKFDNNIFVGFYNSGHTENSNELYNDSETSDNSSYISGTSPVSTYPLTASGGSWVDNASTGSQAGCPRAGSTGSICGSPGLTDETLHTYGYGNVVPTSSSSPVAGAGIAISGITTDADLVIRPSPPSVGALETGSSMPFASASVTLSTITVTPSSASVVVGGATTYTASCTYSDSSTTPCTIAWSDTAAHSSVGSTTGLVTGVSVGVDTITATMSTVTGTATVTIVSTPSTIQGFILQGPIK